MCWYLLFYNLKEKSKISKKEKGRFKYGKLCRLTTKLICQLFNPYVLFCCSSLLFLRASRVPYCDLPIRIYCVVIHRGIHLMNYLYPQIPCTNHIKSFPFWNYSPVQHIKFCDNGFFLSWETSSASRR